MMVMVMKMMMMMIMMVIMMMMMMLLMRMMMVMIMIIMKMIMMLVRMNIMILITIGTESVFTSFPQESLSLEFAKKNKLDFAVYPAPQVMDASSSSHDKDMSSYRRPRRWWSRTTRC